MTKVQMLKNCLGEKGVFLDAESIQEFEPKLAEFFINNKLAKLTVEDAVEKNNKEQELKSSTVTRKKK